MAVKMRRMRGSDDPERQGKPVGAPFRIISLLIGLAVFAGLVWLLFEL
jgi:hypothetical protein